MEVSAQPMTKMEKYLSDSEFNRFGLICLILTIVGCLGGATVGLGAINSTLALIVVVVPTMITLSLLIAVAPMRAIIGVGAITVLIDLTLITYYLLS
jgi:hypothetical protein